MTDDVMTQIQALQLKSGDVSPLLRKGLSLARSKNGAARRF